MDDCRRASSFFIASNRFWSKTCAYRRMIFFPDYPSRLGGDWHPRALAPEDVWLTASDGTKLHAWWISHPAAKFTFLAFHGNASNIANRESTYEFLRDTPANVLALEYRGYGHSEGKPSEAGLYLDADAAYEFLINTKRLDPKSILSFGQSLGTTVAADLAAHHKVGSLILEAPLPSAFRAASKIFWFLPGLSLGAAGLAAAFGVDAASFVVSIVALAMITSVGTDTTSRQNMTLFGSIRQGIAYAVAHPVIRSLLVAYAAMNLFLTGPFMVGAPLLAKLRFGGAAALGLLYSSFGAGALVGTVAAAHDHRERGLGPQLVAVYSLAGVTMIALGLIGRLWISAGILLLLGLIVGYNNIQMLAYLQRQTEPDKMGRVMSLIMLCAHGLLPLSYIAAGAVSQIGITVLFLASGVAVIAITTVLFRSPQF
jgi:pimeloyl-ACP methyl ester carboxylesterase